MKKITSLLLATLSLSSFAGPTDAIIDAKIEKLSKASLNGKIRRLSKDKKLSVVKYLDMALSAVKKTPDRSSDRNGTRVNRNWRYDQTFSRNKVVAYSDDYCTRKIVNIRAKDRCSDLYLFNTEKVWSVSINGKCSNTKDSTFRNKCTDLLSLARSQAPKTNDVTVYSDDYCKKSVTHIDPFVDCSILGKVLSHAKVWSVKLHGQCVNVPDERMSALLCNNYQETILATYENDGRRRTRGEIELFSDDYCNSSKLVANVNRETNCSAMNNVYKDQKVWSVKSRGRCVNIKDTNFLNACERHSKF